MKTVMTRSGRGARDVVVLFTCCLGIPLREYGRECGNKNDVVNHFRELNHNPQAGNSQSTWHLRHCNVDENECMHPMLRVQALRVARE